MKIKILGINFVWSVENFGTLRPRIRVGQAETFVGLHSGNRCYGYRGAIGVWWNNKYHYGDNEPISADSALWKRQRDSNFMPAAHGRDIFYKWA